jgi:MFS family permease
VCRHHPETMNSMATDEEIQHGPSWRARAAGVCRLWRDLGFAVGALLTGILADTFGIREIVWVIAGLTAVSGIGGRRADVGDPHQPPDPSRGWISTRPGCSPRALRPTGRGQW